MASKDPSMEVAKIVATIADPSREVARFNPREGNRGWPKIMANKDLYMEMTRDQSQRMGFHRTGIFLLSMYGYNVFVFLRNGCSLKRCSKGLRKCVIRIV